MCCSRPQNAETNRRSRLASGPRGWYPQCAQWTCRDLNPKPDAYKAKVPPGTPVNHRHPRGRTRTSIPPVSSRVLYPIELRGGLPAIKTNEARGRGLVAFRASSFLWRWSACRSICRHCDLLAAVAPSSVARQTKKVAHLHSLVYSSGRRSATSERGPSPGIPVVVARHTNWIIRDLNFSRVGSAIVPVGIRPTQPRTATVDLLAQIYSGPPHFQDSKAC